jgi:hypothetical protein
LGVQSLKVRDTQVVDDHGAMLGSGPGQLDEISGIVKLSVRVNDTTLKPIRLQVRHAF